MSDIPARYDVPNFPDRALLSSLVKRTRAGCVFPIVTTMFLTFAATVVLAAGYRDISFTVNRCSDAGTQEALQSCLDREAHLHTQFYTEQDMRETCESEVGGTFWSCADYHGGFTTWVLAALCPLVLCLLALLYWLWARFHVPAFFKVLRERPHEIVWVYAIQTRTTKGQVQTSEVVLGLMSGSKAKLYVAGNPDPVLSGVLHLAPDATCGYSAESAQLFNRDPRLLKH